MSTSHSSWKARALRLLAEAFIPRKEQEIQRVAVAVGVLAAGITIVLGLGVVMMLLPFEPLPTPQRARTLDPSPISYAD